MKVHEGVLILLLGLSAFAANVVAPTKSELESMYAVASHELNAGRYSEALKQLDAIDARQPDMAPAKNLRGVALMRMREFGLAEKALQKARELDPGLWEARFNLAEVAFLRKSWAEGRQRFEALVNDKSEQAQGATGDLIQFKILLTYLLEGKEKKATELLDQLQTSTASPVYYCGKAAIAFRHRDETEARAALKAAEQSFSPQLQKLFLESFYEVGWIRKPEGSVPAALEVASLADRRARAQEDFRKAEQAYRQKDFDGALQLLDQVDATVPNQALSYSLRGEILLDQGNDDEAEAALRKALTINPQILNARYNLSRIPFKKRDYEAARKELEAILGATAGGKQQRQREQLIRYQIFLTLLLEGRDGPAQKAMEEFKMMDETPALYYAQAAWGFQHGNATQGNVWVANAGNLYPDDLNRAFAAPFADLGWLGKASAPPITRQAPPVAPFELTFGPAASPSESPGTFLAQTDEAKAVPTPEASATPARIAKGQKPNSRQKSADRKTKKLKSRADKSERANHASSRVRAAKPQTSPMPNAPALPSPSPTAVAEQPKQNLGDKVVRLLRYPWQHRSKTSPSPAPAENKESASASPQPSRPKN